MTTNAILQLGLYLVVLVALVKPLGAYMARVYENKPCGLDTVLKPFESLLYRLCAIDPTVEMCWKHYTYAVLVVDGVGLHAHLLAAFVCLGANQFNHGVPAGRRHHRRQVWTRAVDREFGVERRSL